MELFRPTPNLNPESFSEFRRRMAGVNTAAAAIGQGADTLRAFADQRRRLDAQRYQDLLQAALKLRQIRAMEEKAKKEKETKGPKPEKINIQKYDDYLKQNDSFSASSQGTSKVPGTDIPWSKASDQQKAESWMSQNLNNIASVMDQVRKNPTLYDAGPLFANVERVARSVSPEYWKRVGLGGDEKAALASEIAGHIGWFKEKKGLDFPFLSKGLGPMASSLADKEYGEHKANLKNTINTWDKSKYLKYVAKNPTPGVGMTWDDTKKAWTKDRQDSIAAWYEQNAPGRSPESLARMMRARDEALAELPSLIPTEFEGGVSPAQGRQGLQKYPR